MKAYQEYKKIENEWLKLIPQHWKSVRLKYYADVYGRIGFRGYTKEDLVSASEGALTIGGKHFKGNRLDLSDPEYISWDKFYESPEISVALGDILLTQRGSLGKAILIEEEIGAATINPSVVILKNIKTNKKFLHYFLSSDFIIKTVELINSTTAVPMISQNQIESFVVLIPPSPEQQAIADFLDRKTAQIDALIEKKQQQIDLLQEQRTALINHAVTKGLNPNVRMKDEKSDFFPVIPQNWIKTRLGYLCNQIADGPHYSPDYVDDGIMFISARNVKVDRWEFDSAKYITEEEYQKICQRIIPTKGDVLYTKGGTTGVARVVDFDEPFQVWVHIIVLKPKNEKVNPYFLAYALNSTPCYEQSQLFTRGATNNDLGVTRVVNIELGLPPIDEQVEIVNHLNQQTEKIDNLIHSYENYVDLLQEYRTALISEAVTGKIDVR